MLNTSRDKVLFLQLTDPAGYPPIMHAANILAESDFEAILFSSPTKEWAMKVYSKKYVRIIGAKTRSDHFVKPSQYLKYCLKAIFLAVRERPKFIYASDSLGALPSLLSAWASGAKIIYHEHDSPSLSSDLNYLVRSARRKVTKSAFLVVFPNLERGLIAQREIGFSVNKLRIVWNVPRSCELSSTPSSVGDPLILYYHGNISPAMIPESVIEAVTRFNGKIRLDVVGYESPSGRGYIKSRLSTPFVRYIGQLSRRDLIKQAASAHVGLALIPVNANDVNVQHMVGASNKAFDYLAAGLPLIVSEVPEWQSLIVDSGFGFSCDPNSVDSIEEVLRWFLENPDERMEMSMLGKLKIKSEWNYENQFGKVLKEMLSV